VHRWHHTAYEGQFAYVQREVVVVKDGMHGMNGRLALLQFGLYGAARTCGHPAHLFRLPLVRSALFVRFFKGLALPYPDLLMSKQGRALGGHAMAGRFEERTWCASPMTMF
jgi:hypothetical protein